jgi:hypothetical protein
MMHRRPCIANGNIMKILRKTPDMAWNTFFTQCAGKRSLRMSQTPAGIPANAKI